jgi:hypothetical protein
MINPVLASFGPWKEEHPLPGGLADRLIGHNIVPETVQFPILGSPNEKRLVEAHSSSNMDAKAPVKTKSIESSTTLKSNTALVGDKRPIERFSNTLQRIQELL